MERIYVLVREDLKPGLQMAQACHAVALFGKEHPDAARAWQDGGNNIVCLGVSDEAVLRSVFETHGAAGSIFYEPDVEGFTACALPAGATVKRQLRKCRLALSANV